MTKPIKNTSTNQKTVLTGVKLRNFKSVREATIEIKPLTVLLGSNSAGKSSLLQALVLTSQNFREGSTFGFDLNPAGITLGPLRDLFHKGASATGNIGLGLIFGSGDGRLNEPSSSHFCIDLELASGKKYHPKSSIPIAKFTISESYQDKQTQLTVEPSNPRSPGIFGPTANEIKGTLLTGPPRFRNSLRITHPNMDRMELNIDGVYVPMSEDRFLPFIAPDRPVFLKTEVWKGLLDRFLFDSQFRIVEDIWRIEHRKLVRTLKTDFRKFNSKKVDLSSKWDVLESWFQNWDSEFDKNLEKGLLRLTLEDEEFSRQYSFKELTSVTSGEFAAYLGVKSREGMNWLKMKSPQLLPVAGYELASGYMSAATQYGVFSKKITGGIKYLGPLRAHLLSEQKNGIARELWAPIGVRGERLVNVLESDQAKAFKEYPVPKGSAKSSRFGLEVLSLNQAVNRWVKWFDLGDALEAKDEGIWGSYLELDNEKFHQKGTGISQVLPVITICLLTGVGSLALIEQPELHLHPALQQRLGTFFSEITKSGRRLIIETHSEYIVTRLRREIATGSLDSESVALTFVSSKKSGNSKETTYEQVPISATGVVSRWPQGFYDFTAGDKLAIFEANR
jgi:predicted ATPase